MKKLLGSMSITLSLCLLFSFLFVSFGSKNVSAATAASTLQSIVASAKNGKVINCDYAVKTSNVGTIMNIWGKPDSNNYVAAAKGTYAVYSKKGVVFGYNKGMQIFEVRDTNSASLSHITYSDIQKLLGKPQYESKDILGYRIIGYAVSSSYKLEFVLYNNTNSAKIDHYNVLYPAGTVNSMADDPGRQW